MPKRFSGSLLLRLTLTPVVIGIAPGYAAQGGASAALQDCEALFSTAPVQRDCALCFYRLAKAGDRAAAARIEALADGSEDLPWFVYYDASLLWTKADLAQRRYMQSANAFRRAGDARGEVFSRINRIQLLYNLGRFDDARPEALRVFELTEDSEDRELRVWGTVTLVREHLRTGKDLGRAWDLLKRVEESLEEEESPSLRREYLLLRGSVSLQIGRIEDGQSAYRAVVELAEGTGDLYLEATGRYSLAQASYNRFVEAPENNEALRRETVRLAEEALEVAAASGNRPMEATSAWILARITVNDEEAREYAERCLVVAEGPGLRSFCFNSKAQTLLRSRPRAAERAIEHSLELAREAGDGWSEVYARSEAVRVFWATEPPCEALVDSFGALDVIEAIRQRQTEGSGAQAGMFSLWSDDYLWLSGRLLASAETAGDATWQVPEAFRVSERMRARALTDWLRRSGAARKDSSRSGLVGLEEVQKRLATNQVLLSFQVAPWYDTAGDFGGGSWLMAITHDRVTVHRLPGRVAIRRAVRLFGGLVERRDGAEAGPAAHLYRQLLEPALAELPPEVDRLILIPDDALHRLPFAALRPAPDAPPIGLRYELVRAPSATLWLRWREGEPVPPPERPLLVLADPELPDRLPPETPAQGGEVGALQVAELRGGGVEETGFGPLPHAREEGRDAVRALGGGLLLIGPEASEAALGRLDLGSFGLVHLAAHAVTDEDRPERSAVLLAAGGDLGRADADRLDRPDRSEEAHVAQGADRAAGEGQLRGGGLGQDGRLESSEIARLHLDGRAVVLASCRSAGGTVLRGEGVMSLARAFFQAGAHGVVASLWPLRDDESAVLFRRFYRRLAEGATVGEALHGARREAIEAGEPAAAWAGLVVLGDGELVPAPEARPKGFEPVALAVLVTLALLGGAWLYRQSTAPR